MFKRPVCNYGGELKELSRDDRVIGLPIVVVSSNTTCVVNTVYAVDTLSSAITLTLPATASLGDKISFIDYKNTFSTKNLTVDRNGHKIEGVEQNLVLRTPKSIVLMYIDAVVGWKEINCVAKAFVSDGPIGTILAWHGSYPNCPSLPPEWVVCDGQTIVDDESPFNGQATPNLNVAINEIQRKYLVGGQTSGVITNRTIRAGADSALHYMTVIWIMKIKDSKRTCTVNTYTETYTLIPSDCDNVVEMDSLQPNSILIPYDVFPIGNAISVVQIGSGVTTINAENGVFLNGVDGGSLALTQYTVKKLYQRSSNNWIAG